MPVSACAPPGGCYAKWGVPRALSAREVASKQIRRHWEFHQALNAQGTALRRLRGAALLDGPQPD
jgi:hypothetical protein